MLRKDGNSVCLHFADKKIEEISVVSNIRHKDYELTLLEGLLLGNYHFKKYIKPAEENSYSLKKVSVVSESLENSDLNKLLNLVSAVITTRNLVNEPPSVLTSTLLTEEIKKLSNEAGFSIEILDKTKIQALKMGGILAVNKGSTEPPTFMALEWKPENSVNSKPIILVGKGVVYDTGGYSLKPTHDSMDYMKCDMAGAATAASVMFAVAKNKLPIHLVALIPSTDNRIGPDAYSPGDVITMADGTSVEVLNTDAEGRLILADALWFAKKYNPELVITMATLTGAAQRAIGTQGLVAMGNAGEDVLKTLVNSGEQVYERVAVFPFWEEYKDQLKSEIADLKNIGGDTAGAITAGKFLEHFTDYPFIHLDIAGVAFFKKSSGYHPAGGTGFGVRLVYNFLTNYIVSK